jgi:hypothetical protein
MSSKNLLRGKRPCPGKAIQAYEPCVIPIQMGVLLEKNETGNEKGEGIHTFVIGRNGGICCRLGKTGGFLT